MTKMATDIKEIPDMLVRYIKNAGVYLETGRQMRIDGIRGIITCARGTS